MSNPNRPNLPFDDLFWERALLVGDCMSQIMFGASLAIFIQTIHALTYYPSLRGVKTNPVLVIYSLVIFTLGTAFIGMNMRSLQLMFIDNAANPGGPIGWELTQYSAPLLSATNVVALATGWLADGFLLYRCLVIFHFRLYVVAIPIMMYLGSISMGILLLFQSAQPGTTLFGKIAVNFGVPYFALSSSLNVVITILISSRLLFFRRSVQQTLGRDIANATPYLSIAALVIESSMLYAVISIVFVIPYGLHSHVADILLPCISQAPVISSLLIIFRVATRRAWDRHTMTAPTESINFAHGETATMSTEPVHLATSEGRPIHLKGKASSTLAGSFGDFENRMVVENISDSSS